MSAPGVQAHAQAAVTDGFKHQELELLSGIGSHFMYPGNCARDIQRVYDMSESNKLPEPLLVRIPLYDLAAKPPQIVPRVAWPLNMRCVPMCVSRCLFLCDGRVVMCARVCEGSANA